MRESFELIRRSRSLMLLPLISWSSCVLVSVIVIGGGALVFDLPLGTVRLSPTVSKPSLEAVRQLTLIAVDELLGDPEMGEATEPTSPEERKMAEHVWLVLFVFYLANSCVIVYFNVAFAHVALDRLTGGCADLDAGLQVAWKRKWSVFQWAFLSATVGILLKMVRDRSDFGKWIAGILGYFWKLGTYFVMPLLALEDVSPGDALNRSASLITERWGDMVIAGFSFPLLFSILCIPGLALFFVAGILGQSFGLAAAVTIAYWLFLAVFVFSAEQVFTAALYLYAKQDKAPKGFLRLDLKSAWEGLPPLPAGQAL